MSNQDGWTGPMTGPMRGEPLVRCSTHGGWWTTSTPCPACGLQAQIDALMAAQARRCAECKRKPA
jgi:hypothetical protein